MKRYLVTLHKKADFRGFLPFANRGFSGFCTTVNAIFKPLFGDVGQRTFNRRNFFGENAKNTCRFFVIIVHIGQRRAFL